MKPAWSGTVSVRQVKVPATSNVHMRRDVTKAVGRMIHSEWTSVFGRPSLIMSVDLEFRTMAVKVVMKLKPIGRNVKRAECETGFCTGCLSWFSAIGHPDNGCPAGTVYSVLAS